MIIEREAGKKVAQNGITGGNERTQGRPGRTNSFPLGGVTLQLFAILILPLTVLLLAITFWSIYVHQQAMRNLVGERDERAVQTLAAALQGAIDQHRSAVQILARQAAAAPESEFENILDSTGSLLAGSTVGLAVFDPDGNLLAWEGERDLWEAVAVGSWAKPDEITPGDPPDWRISRVYLRPNSNEKLFFISAVEQDPRSGRTIIAIGAVSPVELARRIFVQALPPDQGTGVIIVDEFREVIYVSGSPGMSGPLSAYENLSDQAGVGEALAGETGTTYVPADGSEHVVAYTPVEPAGWALVIEEPWEMVSSPLLSYTQVAPLVLVPVLLLMFLALWFAVKQIVQPLQALESQAVSLAWGDYAAVKETVGGIPEIQRVQGGLVYLAQKVQAAQQSLHGYIGAITAGQEEERRRLARELHDDTIQSLIALKQRVQLVQLNPTNGGLPRALVELEELTEKTIENLRRVTRALRPIYLEDLGLSAALEMLSREVGQTSNSEIEYRVRGSERRLPPKVELALYRMVQEALSNIVRHAHASQVSLEVDFKPQTVILEISDNGKGFEAPVSPAEFAPAGHFGLLGMYERAELIGARLEISSVTDMGTRIRITLSGSPEEMW